MNIQKTLIANINDTRTGVVTDSFELAHCNPNSHAFTLDPDGGGAEILVRHRDLGFRVWVSRTQTKELADDLRYHLEKSLPEFANIRKEALAKGYERLASFVAVLDLAPVTILHDPVYTGEEALESLRISAQPGAIVLTLGDNRSWGCERRMTEEEAHDLLDAFDQAIVAWDEYI